MTWQISRIILYRKGGEESREIEFERARLNIITGRSQRGKSTILEIVDYCLGSRTCRIPKGKVRDSLDAVGLLLTREGSRLGLVRRLPKGGKLGTQSFWLNRSPEAGLPSRLPDDNFSMAAVKEEISSFTGIEDLPVLTSRSEEPEFDRAPASIRHCAPYIFQHQDVIGSRNVLFHGMEAVWQSRHRIDALTYFLGVVSIETLARRRRLLDLKRRLATEQRRNAEIDQLSSRGLERGVALWEEASSLGLLSGESPPGTMEELAGGLRQAQEVKNEVAALSRAGQLPKLERLERSLVRRQRRLRHERSTTDQYLQLSRESTSVNTRLSQRLAVVKLLPSRESHSCPICEGEMPWEKWEQQLDMAAQLLGEEVQTNPRVVTHLKRVRAKLSNELDVLDEKLASLRRRINNTRRNLEDFATIAELHDSRLRLAGRIAEYLRSVSLLFRSSKTETSELEEEVEALEAEVGDRALEEKVRRVEGALARRVGLYSRELGAEFADHPVRLRLRDLLLELKFDGNWVSLSEIGSAANWLIYHLSAVMGLHETFLAVAGPVPRVLLLDQPSQAWFPPEKVEYQGTTGDLMPQKDEDRRAVERVYRVLAEFVGATGLQVIVLDHARLEESWFTEATIRDWHREGGLVPESWFTEEHY